MKEPSLFIAIEGLDGSGKTSIARQLVYFLQHALKKSIKLTFEPHDPSCGGLYIRRVLEKKISDFSHETLMLAFATNRLDHCTREINPWLSGDVGRILICDRYYLSSLVYQSNEQFSMEQVMKLNSSARQPDLTIFMNVSNKVCYQRMKVRNKPEELFERDLSNTRDKYMAAIRFLRETRNEQIVVVDASSSLPEVLEAVVKVVASHLPGSEKELLASISSYTLPAPAVLSLDGAIPDILGELVEEVRNLLPQPEAAEAMVRDAVHKRFQKLSLSQRGALFLNYLESTGYQIGSRHPGNLTESYELTFPLPGGLTQRGTALLLSESQRTDLILESVTNAGRIADFLFVFVPGPVELSPDYYERGVVSAGNGTGLFPPVKWITEYGLQQVIAQDVLRSLSGN